MNPWFYGPKFDLENFQRRNFGGNIDDLGGGNALVRGGDKLFLPEGQVE